VKSPKELCWHIQHNAVWGDLFNFDHLNGRGGVFVKSKICRRLYEDVVEMTRSPNFKGARILGFCLNVMGLRRNKERYFNDSRALHRAILIWTKKNFARLCDFDKRIAEACLVDGMTYDAANHQIVREYLRWPGQREPHCVFLSVDPHVTVADYPTQTALNSTRVNATKGRRHRRRRGRQRPVPTSPSDQQPGID